jgi:TrmH family RNA methyltransferase
VEQISSRKNPIVKRFRGLARSVRPDDEVLLDGVHLIREALNADVPLEVVAIAQSLPDAATRGLLRRASAAGARTLSVSESVLSAISPVKQPTGIVAIARCGKTTIDRIFERTPQLVMVLGRVQDPGNVGAIIRACEACGATGVITTPGTADPFGWKALRGSMGSAFRLPVAAQPSVELAVQAASIAGLRVYASVPRDGTALPSVDLTVPSAILLGGEGAGLEPDAIVSAHERITIPMTPPVESLNVATAAALILYEASRQRGFGQSHA